LRGDPCGCYSEQNAGDEAERARESEHGQRGAGVNGDILLARESHSKERVRAGIGDDEAGDAAAIKARVMAAKAISCEIRRADCFSLMWII